MTSLLYQKHKTEQFSPPPTVAAPLHPPPTTQLAWIFAIKHTGVRQLLDTELQTAPATLFRPLWPRSVERRIDSIRLASIRLASQPLQRFGRHHGCHSHGSRSPRRLKWLCGAQYLEESGRQRARVQPQRRRLQLSPDKGAFCLVPQKTEKLPIPDGALEADMVESIAATSR